LFVPAGGDEHDNSCRGSELGDPCLGYSFCDSP
jgi:hypothetical protein